jgi:hypothetical protein
LGIEIGELLPGHVVLHVAPDPLNRVQLRAIISVRLTLWARIYHDHSWLLTCAMLVTVLGQQ